MDKRDFYFFNVREVCTENYHLRINSHYRLVLSTNENSSKAELLKVIINAHWVTLKFQLLKGGEPIDIKFNVFANDKKAWRIFIASSLMSH